MELQVYNSLTRKKEIITPDDGVVNLYFCGPTVYWFQHIGNLRAFFVMDSMRRAVKYLGYKINHAMNITDVGHMTSDADEGEDKMELASKREQKTPQEIADYYWSLCHKDMQDLNIEEPEHICPATSVIPEIIKFVQDILDNGYGYITKNGVYYDTSKYSHYGELGGMNQDDKLFGARIEVDDEKKNPADFVLWVIAKDNHIQKWDSPWGVGYPGWHIECSAIGNKFLGEHIHLHGGGIEHRTVHHENEIAQNFAKCGHEVVDCWFHLEHLMFDGGKMSKSKGGIYTLSALKDSGYSPMDLRLFYLSAHYTKPQNFTFEALNNAKESYNNLKKLILKHKKGTNLIEKSIISDYKNKFSQYVADDINSPLALSVLWDALKNNSESKDIYELVLDFDRFLGLRLDEIKEEKTDIPQDIIDIAEERKSARINKDYKTSDILRDKIASLGFSILDKAGNEYEIIKK
ncbi:MAG: cysteine--tRNA ligase [Clostridiales bacterium]|nr:cysteine--tRNA ligase [Clostridiales bacterium]